MEHAIGEIITLPDGRKAEVVESDHVCFGCALYRKNGDMCIKWREECKTGECNAEYRTDHKDIIYKEIKEE